VPADEAAITRAMPQVRCGGCSAMLAMRSPLITRDSERFATCKLSIAATREVCILRSCGSYAHSPSGWHRAGSWRPRLRVQLPGRNSSISMALRWKFRFHFLRRSAIWTESSFGALTSRYVFNSGRQQRIDRASPETIPRGTWVSSALTVIHGRLSITK